MVTCFLKNLNIIYKSIPLGIEQETVDNEISQTAEKTYHKLCLISAGSICAVLRVIAWLYPSTALHRCDVPAPSCRRHWFVSLEREGEFYSTAAIQYFNTGL